MYNNSYNSLSTTTTVQQQEEDHPDKRTHTTISIDYITKASLKKFGRELGFGAGDSYADIIRAILRKEGVK